MGVAAKVRVPQSFACSMRVQHLRERARLPLLAPRVLRCSQLDASRLDDDLQGMLLEQAVGLCSRLSPRLAIDYLPEIRALLELLVFRFSVWTNGSSPGAQLLNLRYTAERPAEDPREGSTAATTSSNASNSSAAAERLAQRMGVGGPGLSRAQKLG